MTVFNIAILFFIAIASGVVAVYLGYVSVKTSPRYLVKKRMRSLATDTEERRFPQELRVEILGEMNPLDRFLYRFKLTRKLDRLIETAGIKGVKAGVKFFVFLIVVCALLAYVIGVIIGLGGIFSLIFLAIGAALPLIYLGVKRKRRLKRFTEQLPDALDMIARSLKAGHSLNSAFQMVSSEMSEPTGSLFKTAYEEQAFGLSMREAVEHMVKLMPSKDLKFFVMATNIQREVGGNLGEILERLAHTIRERMKIRRQVRVYTAQARLSGYVLAGTPLFMVLFFYLFVPGYIQELFTVKWGVYAVYLAIAGQVIGFLVILKIINIKI